ncbi:MAG: ComF family protein [Rudaea sp.]
MPVNLKSMSSVDSRSRSHRLLPTRCLLCGACGDAPRDLCVACAGDLVRNRHACARCALPLSMDAPLCGECLARPPPFDAAFAPFEYAHPLDLLLTGLKFGRSLAAGRVLADLWAHAIRNALADGSVAALPDVLVPIPLHRDRLRERGYNQALELARALGRDLGVPVVTNLLRRDRPTPAQTGLDAAARRRSLRGAFSFVPIAGKPLPTRIALVDDVMTTGATIRECARVLRKSGAARIEAWALARAPRLR